MQIDIALFEMLNSSFGLESQLLTNKFVIGYDNDTNVKKSKYQEISF